MRIGVDIGGTKTHVVAVAADGVVAAQFRLPSGHGEMGVLASAIEGVEAVLAQLPGERVESIGIGIPGAIDVEAGVVRHAANLGITELPLAAALRERFGTPTQVENDVNAAALGAAERLGLRHPSASLAYLNVGTGIAAGFIVDGRIVRGAHGIAGEIGHIVVQPGGELCACGQRGCLETIAGGGAIERHSRVVGPDAALELATEAIATAVQILLLTIDPQRIVLGGGVLSARATRSRMLAVLAERGAHAPFLAAAPIDELVVALPDGALPALGAALVPDQGAQPVAP